MPPQENSDTEHVDLYEYIIVGAGPAGVQMAYFLQKAERSYLLLESGEGPATFFKTHPRHRKLISINKRYNGFPEDEFNLRHDWNSLLSDNPELRFTKYSDQLFPQADTLVRYMNDYVDYYKLKLVPNTRVTRISRAAGGSDGDADTPPFLLECENGRRYRTQVLLMACGALKENVPDIPGIELATTYATHSINQQDYINKKVCVVGAANSGFEVADHLAGHAAAIHIYNHTPVKMAWDSHFPGHLRAINNSIIDMFHLKSLHAVRDGEITKLEKTKKKKVPTATLR